jgi:RHS repeat-associated protein
MGEKFTVNPATGTGTLTIPLASSPGRAGFGPQLTLSYDSGSGNGPFGVGWSLALPAVTRKTDQGIPRYLDDEESDIFVLSGAEDLVPLLDQAGDRVRPDRRTVHDVTYDIYRYRPRIEGLFARIERWTVVDSGISHWRSITRDNVTTLYGLDPESRIVDPNDPRRVFSYLICRTFDDKGNLALYKYVREDGAAVDTSQAHEANRTRADRTAQRYLKRILYAAEQPYFPDWSAKDEEVPIPTNWHLEVVFDYGDHRSRVAPTPTPDRAWAVRPDPFSTYRAGFEVRTYRRCSRVLVFHHFPNENNVGANCLVRSTDLRYSDQDVPTDPRNPIYTFLTSVSQTGYRRAGNGYRRRSLPQLEFEYSQPRVQPDVLTLDSDSRANLPEGMDGSRYQWVDLDGEGLPGILAEQDGGWGYKRNLSPLNQQTLPDGGRAVRARFGALETVATMPSRSELPGGGQFLDLSGDGQLDLVAFDGPTPGFFERTQEATWESFRTFAALPRLDWSDPNLKFVDLTGDGHADVLLTEDGLFTFYPSLGEAGFGEADVVHTPWDEQRGPHVVFADGTQTVFLADMSGDGLTDIVRIRSGETCYWPNLGYGRFGSRVAMDNAPRFVGEERFDPRRIRLADVDGTGTTDLLYVGEDGVLVCFNRSGNSWAAPHQLAVFPTADNLSDVQVTDLLGTGTACLVWSSPLPGEARAPLQYIDLMGGQKPHLMVRTRNNLGAETRLRYAPSTRFYLADKMAGWPWITRLPYPVHVVERVEVYDWIGRSRFATRYAYHHGYFDGHEREFRGFGMVEQWDTEEHRGETAFPEANATNWEATSQVPPVLTRTWFHTGALVEGGTISRQYAREYWTEPALRPENRAADREAMLLPDSVLQEGLTPDETRQAYRALRGMTLRTEIFAEDGSTRAELPYSVTEQNFFVRLVQPLGKNRHAVFFAHPRETLSFHYERRPDDPRVTHDATLEVDSFGNVRRSVSVGYPRRAGYPDPEPELSAAFRRMLAYDQARIDIMATENRFTDDTLTDAKRTPDAHRTPLPSESITAELMGIRPAANRPGVTNLFRFDELEGHWQVVWDGAHDIPYEEIPPSDIDGAGMLPNVPKRRIVEHTRTVYRRNNLTGLLPLHQLESLALPGDSYRLALTRSLITRVFDNLVSNATLTEGGYVQLPGGNDWWIPSGRVFYSPGDGDTPAQERTEALAHFYLTRRSRDQFGAVNRIAYDPYDLLATTTTDPVSNSTAAANDYRVLLPFRITDPNGNRSQVAFDALGMVVGTAAMGKTTEKLGDSLSGFDSDIDEAVMLAHLADPLKNPSAMLGNASSRMLYDLFAYYRSRDNAQPDPPVVYTLARETHVSDLAANQTTRYQHAFTYSDGFGREVQKKGQAEPGAVPGVGPNIAPRWVGSGWTIYNNKGKPVRTNEPFFSATHHFEFARQVGVSSVLFYDPIGRLVTTLHPDNTWAKMVFDPWRQETWDANDTVLISDPRADPDVGDHFRRLLGEEPNAFSSWHDRRIGGTWGDTPAERAAAQDAAKKVAAQQKTAARAGTPSVAHFGAGGRVNLAVSDNGARGRYPTRIPVDDEGKPRAVFDALGRRVFEYCRREPQSGRGFRHIAGYDLAGNLLYHTSMDGGARRSLANVAGNPIRAWDALGHAFRVRYDLLQRPTHRYVSTDGGKEILLERSIYGEALSNRNLCGRLYRQYDTGGLASNERYDFKGNLLESARQFAREYRTREDRQSVDWSALDNLTNVDDLNAAAAPLLIPADRYTAITTYDALNRPIQMVAPHSAAMRPNVLRPSYNEANLLEKMDVWIRQANVPTTLLDPKTADLHAVTNIGYNARGQRTLLALGNDTVTTYDYDPQTFRLSNLSTARPNSFAVEQRVVQELAYTYDPVGNITRITDTADTQNVVFCRNQRVEPSADYTYDAIYRLTSATGREHLGQNGGVLKAPQQIASDDAFRTGLAHPCDGNAMGTYTETYTYDAAGNLLRMLHQVSSGSWTRRYAYTEPSQITPTETSNRLSSTSLPSDPVVGPYTARYSHDAHGNIVLMPHLPKLTWDEQDRLRATSRQAVNAGTPETTFYVFDVGGQRLRKVTDRQAAAGQQPRRRKERLYLAGVEIYREYAGDGTTVALERETLHVPAGPDRVALIETRTAGVNPAPARLVRYQYTNHLGSAVLELDDHADIISYEEYFPYGSSAYQLVRSQTETPKSYRYTSKERDEESGLYYHGARYYAPWLGTWISADPTGIAGGINLYNYARSNPVIYDDPDGSAPRIKLKPFGSGGIYKEMGPALRRAGKPISQDEHAHAFGIQTRTLKKSAGSSESAVTKTDYRNQPTLREPTDMARIKTDEDLRIMRELDKARESGQMTDELAEQTRPEAAMERMKTARDIAKAQREASGKSTRDLDKITDEEIERSVALQTASLHDVGSRQSFAPISRATKKEIEKALEMLRENGKGGAAALVLILAATAEASAAQQEDSGRTSDATDAPSSYEKRIASRLEVSRRVTEALVEDSPSDLLTALVGTSTALDVGKLWQLQYAKMNLTKFPSGVVIENEPYFLDRSTGDLYSFHGLGELRLVGRLGKLGHLYGGMGKLVYEQNEKFYLVSMP